MNNNEMQPHTGRTQKAAHHSTHHHRHRTYVALEHVQKFLAYGSSLGVPVAALLEQHQLDLRRDTNKQGYVPGHIWEAIIVMALDWCRRLDEPLPGLRVAADLGTGFVGVWAYIMETASTLGQALETAAEYQKLHTTAVNITPRRTPAGLDIVITPRFRNAQVREQMADWYLALIDLFVQHCTDDARDAVISVNFAHPAPDNARDRQRYYALFKCPVQFDCDGNFIRLAADALSRPLVTADPDVQVALEQQAKEKLRAYNHDTDYSEVHMQRALRQLLAEGRACKENLAASLAISPRTLQRRLSRQGSSYRQLLHSVRRAAADDYLRQSTLPISSIAARLGFNDPQSFSRWFLEQTGNPPSLFRRLAAL